MKNMRLPIDIIWLDEHKRIVSIVSRAQPCAKACPSLSATGPSKYVLEVNSGFAEKCQLQTGAALDF
jgi:uncharacterized membrane protein (UPF0127 family)